MEDLDGGATGFGGARCLVTFIDGLWTARDADGRLDSELAGFCHGIVEKRPMRAQGEEMLWTRPVSRFR